MATPLSGCVHSAKSLSTTSHGLGKSAKLATCFGPGRAASSHAAHRCSRATAWASGLAPRSFRALT
eukprot:14880272-Alexandrium_andersonii.AAC.1